MRTKTTKLDMAGAVAIAPKGAEVITLKLFRFPTKTRLTHPKIHVNRLCAILRISAVNLKKVIRI
jgi:hypothetical protein